MAKAQDVQISIPAPNIQRATVKIRGTAPIIFHKFSEKVKREMLEKQQKKAQKGREVRDPSTEYKLSFYIDQEGHVAFPTNSIKQAMVGATRNVQGVTMTLLRGAVFVLGDDDKLTKVLHKGKPLTVSDPIIIDEDDRPEGIYGYDPKHKGVLEMRQDPVRVGMGSADLRFRGQVRNWEMELIIAFNASVISLEQILNLLNIAGFSSGIGEWRPEKNGDFGTFEVVAE